MEENNFWVARKLRRDQFKYRMEFMRCLARGGSYIIDWDVVNEKSFGKKQAAAMKAAEPRWIHTKETHGNSDGLSAQ